MCNTREENLIEDTERAIETFVNLLAKEEPEILEFLFLKNMSGCLKAMIRYNSPDVEETMGNLSALKNPEIMSRLLGDYIFQELTKDFDDIDDGVDRDGE